MKISPNSLNIQFQGMVPINKYKGPLLQLTEGDKARISELQESINRMEFELYHLNRKFNGKRLPNREFQYYVSQERRLQAYIEELKEMIQDIKINRFNKQKEGKV